MHLHYIIKRWLCQMHLKTHVLTMINIVDFIYNLYNSFRKVHYYFLI